MTARETFTSHADPELLSKIREIAQVNERDFETVLEDAMWVYVTCLEKPNVRPSVMAHYRASLERNRRLAELLADS